MAVNLQNCASTTAPIKTFIIVHGTKGSPEGNWFPWLAAELKKLGKKVFVPRMPTPDGQNLTQWLAALKQQVGDIDSQTCIIGHSIGAVFLLRYLEQALVPIGASVFVAGLTGAIGIPEYDSLNSTFVGSGYDWPKIKSNAGRILCIAGDNDPYVPIYQPIEMAKMLGVSLKIIQGGGHLNAESGYFAFPELLEELGET
jgi:predicted alpha/beta hydrolase family esterase